MQSTGIVPNQPGDRMRDAEVVLNQRQERADPNELLPERQRREEQRDEERRPPHLVKPLQRVS